MKHKPIAQLTDEELRQAKEDLKPYLKIAQLTGIYDMEKLREVREVVNVRL